MNTKGETKIKMTEEQATKLIELVEDYNKLEKGSYILVGFFVLCIMAWMIFEIVRYQKIKKMHNEYKASLTEEQIKAVNKNKEYLQ